MQSITRKGNIKSITDKSLGQYQSDGLSPCLQVIRTELLEAKVKFPLLEYAAQNLVHELTEDDIIKSIPIIRSWDSIGGNVLIGIFLVNLLEKNYHQAIEETVKVTATADIWYICDIIGERVYGWALLHYFSQTIKAYQRLSKHPSPWVIRSLGAGAHHAIKKGLPSSYVEQVFQFLLGHANHKHKEVRQGIGWAAKTTAKFHPEIIDRYKEQIADQASTAGWFRRKTEIGLARNRYAQRN